MKGKALGIALIIFLVFLLGIPASHTSNAPTSSDASSTPVVSEESSASAVSDEPAKPSVSSSSTAASASAETASERSESAEGGELIVRFIDVGQGDGILISCEGRSMLIDGGPSKQSSKIYAILKRLGISHLDYIVATHPDADHIGATSGALNYASCDVCYCSTKEYDTKTFTSLVKYLDKLGVGITIPTCGDSFQLGSATCTFVGPVHPSDTDNDNSLVIRLDYGSTSFLFTGDAETEEEQDILASGADIDVDVLKVGHHGSKSSTSARFLKAANPEYAVISVGKNSYGHPTEEVLDRLNEAGITTYRTDEVGSIIMKSDGENLDVETTTGYVTE